MVNSVPVLFLLWWWLLHFNSVTSFTFCIHKGVTHPLNTIFEDKCNRCMCREFGVGTAHCTHVKCNKLVIDPPLCNHNCIGNKGNLVSSPPLIPENRRDGNTINILLKTGLVLSGNDNRVLSGVDYSQSPDSEIVNNIDRGMIQPEPPDESDEDTIEDESPELKEDDKRTSDKIKLMKDTNEAGSLENNNNATLIHEIDTKSSENNEPQDNEPQEDEFISDVKLMGNTGDSNPVSQVDTRQDEKERDSAENQVTESRNSSEKVSDKPELRRKHSETRKVMVGRVRKKEKKTMEDKIIRILLASENGGKVVLSDSQKEGQGRKDENNNSENQQQTSQNERQTSENQRQTSAKSFIDSGSGRKRKSNKNRVPNNQSNRANMELKNSLDMLFGVEGKGSRG